MTIFFYSKTDHYGDFSNFSKHGIEIEGKWYKTTEHYFQSQKFDSADYRERIRLAPNASSAAKLGRSRNHPIRADWDQVKDDVMRRAVLAKFQKNSDACELLLSTGDEDIVENAPGDYYWGCGKDGSGQNKLGLILVKVREQIKRET